MGMYGVSITRTDSSISINTVVQQLYHIVIWLIHGIPYQIYQRCNFYNRIPCCDLNWHLDSWIIEAVISLQCNLVMYMEIVQVSALTRWDGWHTSYELSYTIWLTNSHHSTKLVSTLLCLTIVFMAMKHWHFNNTIMKLPYSCDSVVLSIMVMVPDRQIEPTSHNLVSLQMR